MYKMWQFLGNGILGRHQEFTTMKTMNSQDLWRALVNHGPMSRYEMRHLRKIAQRLPDLPAKHKEALKKLAEEFDPKVKDPELVVALGALCLDHALVKKCLNNKSELKRYFPKFGEAECAVLEEICKAYGDTMKQIELYTWKRDRLVDGRDIRECDVSLTFSTDFNWNGGNQ